MANNDMEENEYQKYEDINTKSKASPELNYEEENILKPNLAEHVQLRDLSVEKNEVNINDSEKSKEQAYYYHEFN